MKAILASAFARGDHCKVVAATARVLQVPPYSTLSYPVHVFSRKIVCNYLSFSGSFLLISMTNHLQLSIVLGVALAVLLGLGMEFGSRVFTKDVNVLKIVHKGLPVLYYPISS